MHHAAARVAPTRSSRSAAAATTALRSPLALAAPGGDAARMDQGPVLAMALATLTRPGLATDQALIDDSGVARRGGEGDLEQRSPTASTSEARPELEALADNAVVDAAIAADWVASKPNTPGQKREHGFWVLRAADKTISVKAFPSNGTNDSLTPGPMPTGAIAFFHTHPNTSAEGYAQEPSTADKNFATAAAIPGLVMSHAGMFYFGPALP